MRTITLFALLLSLCAAQSAVTLDVRSGTIYDVLTNGVPWGVTNAIAPTFNPSSGAVPLSVEITSAGNLIYWTTNGDSPTTNLAGIPSGESVMVTSTNHPLKALAWFADGYRLPSTVTSAIYTNATPAAECAEWLVATNWNQPADVQAAQICQYIPTNTPVEICQIDGVFSATGRGTYFEVRTAQNGGGDLIGSFSSTNSSVADTFVSYTFATNPVTTGPFYVYPRTTEEFSVYVRYNDTAPGQEILNANTRLTNQSLAIRIHTK